MLQCSSPGRGCADNQMAVSHSFGDMPILSRCGEHLASLRGPGDRPSRSRIQRYYPESPE